jgi:hypothetical protein
MPVIVVAGSAALLLLVVLVSVVKPWRSVVKRGLLAITRVEVLVFAVGAVMVAAYVGLPHLLVHDKDFTDNADLYNARNDIRTSAVQAVGALVLLGGLIFTARTVRLNRDGNVTDRFSKAAEHLGHISAATRVGGVYALEQIMRDAPREQTTALETLAALIRDQASTRSPDDDPAPDLAAAVRVIGRRDPSRDTSGVTVNLSDVNLSRCSLRAGDYSGVNLWNARLDKANLTGASFIGTNLERARLDGAFLARAKLEHASLDGASLQGAKYDDSTTWPAGFDAASLGARNLSAGATA